MRLRVLAGWAGLVATITLATRAVVYALAPRTPLALRLGSRLGGPHLVVVIAAALLAGGLVAGALLWLAYLGVRERWALAAPETRGRRPRLAVGRCALRAGGLWLASSAAFAAVESYLHMRAGLGFHGLSCLAGPVHVDALPVTAGLALIVAAAVTAIEHVLLWARRVVARAFGARPRPARARAVRLATPLTLHVSSPALALGPLLPRPPPLQPAG